MNALKSVTKNMIKELQVRPETWGFVVVDCSEIDRIEATTDYLVIIETYESLFSV